MKHRLKLAFCVATGLISGCISPAEKSAKLGDVAKKWCLNIRASQVIPVYPLTEDVQVGDVFIVQRPVDDEVQMYEQQGFLPLGHHLERLPLTDFTNFYGNKDFGISTQDYPPVFFRSPKTDGSTATAAEVKPPGQNGEEGAGGPKDKDAGSTSGKTKDDKGADPSAPGNQPTTKPSDKAATNTGVTSKTKSEPVLTNWSVGPRAAFPSYSFDIERSGSLDLGLPIHAVPVAFGALGASSAKATVSLTDAYTYGMDEATLTTKIREWAAKPDNQKMLRQYAPRYEPDRLTPTTAFTHQASYRMNYSYLRVVTRVYYVKTVNVSVTNASQGGGNLKVGVVNQSSLVDPSNGTYTNLLATLNSGLANKAGDSTSTTTSDPKPAAADATAKAAKATDAASTVTKTAAAAVPAFPNIGGALRFAALSNDSVSMDETFDRPLTIGYLAFDIPIDEEGNLGTRPVSTALRMDRFVPQVADAEVQLWAEENPDAHDELVIWVGKEGSANRTWLKQHGYPTTVDDNESDDAGHLVGIGLLHFLADPPFFKSPSLLYSRLSSEVVERPEGLSKVHDDLDTVLPPQNCRPLLNQSTYAKDPSTVKLLTTRPTQAAPTK